MAALRRHAYSRSPSTPPSHARAWSMRHGTELPTVTKGELMAHWDEVVTEPAARACQRWNVIWSS